MGILVNLDCFPASWLAEIDKKKVKNVSVGYEMYCVVVERGTMLLQAKKN